MEHVKLLVPALTPFLASLIPKITKQALFTSNFTSDNWLLWRKVMFHIHWKASLQSLVDTWAWFLEYHLWTWSRLEKRLVYFSQLWEKPQLFEQFLLLKSWYHNLFMNKVQFERGHFIFFWRHILFRVVRKGSHECLMRLSTFQSFWPYVSSLSLD